MLFLRKQLTSQWTVGILDISILPLSIILRMWTTIKIGPKFRQNSHNFIDKPSTSMSVFYQYLIYRRRKSNNKNNYGGRSNQNKDISLSLVGLLFQQINLPLNRREMNTLNRNDYFTMTFSFHKTIIIIVFKHEQKMKFYFDIIICSSATRKIYRIFQ